MSRLQIVPECFILALGLAFPGSEKLKDPLIVVAVTLGYVIAGKFLK